jgi:hypothetical protein
MDRDYTKLETQLADLEAAWKDRLKDAEALLAAGRNGSAIAMAVYALEIRLKVFICRRLDVQQLPRAFETHDLDGLLLLAGLSNRIKRRNARKVKPNWDAITKVAERANELRYTPESNWTHAQASLLLKQLKHSSDGILPWLARQ